MDGDRATLQRDKLTFVEFERELRMLASNQ